MPSAAVRGRADLGRSLRAATCATVLLLSGCAADTRTQADQRQLKVADVELASGMPEAALQIMQEAAAKRPGDIGALTRLGEANMALGRWEAAETSFRQALSRRPGSVDAAFGLARLHLVTNPPAALPELRRLAARRPRDTKILTDYGVACDLVGRSEEAQQSYRSAIALDPAGISAQVDLGLSLALSGHPDQAVAILSPLARSAEATPRIRQDYAVAATLAGRKGAAREALGRDLPQAQIAQAVHAYAALATPPR